MPVFVYRCAVAVPPVSDLRDFYNATRQQMLEAAMRFVQQNNPAN